MTSRYETSQIAGTLDAFHDAALAAEILRVYNYKRAFCGQTRADFGTPTTSIFKNPTNYADGPVTTDVDTATCARDENAMRYFLLGMYLTIPQTIAQSYTISGSRYIWVVPGTNDPLTLPETWMNGTSLVTLKDTCTWKALLDGMIDAINSMTEMRLLTTPTIRLGATTWRGYYVDYSNNEAPFSFRISDSSPYLSSQTITRPVFSSFTIAEDEVANERGYRGLLPAYSLRGSFMTQWDMNANEFSGSFAHSGGPTASASGTITRNLLSIYRSEFSITVNVPTTTSYTIQAWPSTILFSSFPFNLSKMAGESMTITIDGNSASWSISSLWQYRDDPLSLPPLSITRTISSPGEVYDVSMEISGMDSVTDYWGGDTFGDVTETTSVCVDVNSSGVHTIGGNNAYSSYVVRGGSSGVHNIGQELRPGGTNERPTFGYSDRNSFPPFALEDWDGRVDDRGYRYTVPSGSFALSGRIRVYSHPTGDQGATSIIWSIT